MNLQVGPPQHPIVFSLSLSAPLLHFIFVGVLIFLVVADCALHFASSAILYLEAGLHFLSTLITKYPTRPAFFAGKWFCWDFKFLLVIAVNLDDAAARLWNSILKVAFSTSSLLP